jgi:hypothetical protein
LNGRRSEKIVEKENGRILRKKKKMKDREEKKRTHRHDAYDK